MNVFTVTKEETRPKTCKCFYCHKGGHYADRCLEKLNKNLKFFEIDEDFEKIIDNGDFIPIKSFQDQKKVFL